MAILKAIEVRVVVNRQALPEYQEADDNVDNTTEVTKYIEAISGAEFTISVTIPKFFKFNATAMSIQFQVDGVIVQDELCEKAEMEDLRHLWKYTCKGFRTKDGRKWFTRPLKFDEINIVEASTSSAGSRDGKKCADLGTIAVDIFDTKIIQECSADSCSDTSNFGELDASTHVAEKELKGRDVTHKAQLGAKRRDQSVDIYDVEDISLQPVARFRFKYRSRSSHMHDPKRDTKLIIIAIEVLQVLHLIPRSPSPPREPTPIPLEERDIDELDAEELKELGRRQQARYRKDGDAANEKKTGVKSEKVKAEPKTKRENDLEYEELLRSARTKKAKTRPFANEETIDLD